MTPDASKLYADKLSRGDNSPVVGYRAVTEVVGYGAVTENELAAIVAAEGGDPDGMTRDELLAAAGVH